MDLLQFLNLLVQNKSAYLRHLWGGGPRIKNTNWALLYREVSTDSCGFLTCNSCHASILHPLYCFICYSFNAWHSKCESVCSVSTSSLIVLVILSIFYFQFQLFLFINIRLSEQNLMCWVLLYSLLFIIWVIAFTLQLFLPATLQYGKGSKLLNPSLGDNQKLDYLEI